MRGNGCSCIGCRPAARSKLRFFYLNRNVSSIFVRNRDENENSLPGRRKGDFAMLVPSGSGSCAIGRDGKMKTAFRKEAFPGSVRMAGNMFFLFRNSSFRVGTGPWFDNWGKSRYLCRKIGDTTRRRRSAVAETGGLRSFRNVRRCISALRNLSAGCSLR